jgi:hypothetical protein
LNAIDIDAATIWEVEEGGEIKIDLKIVDDSSRNNIK